MARSVVIAKGSEPRSQRPPHLFCKSVIPREFLVWVAQQCECKGIRAATPIRLNLMLRLPLPPFLCKCSFHGSCSSIVASVHFVRLGKIRVGFALCCSSLFCPRDSRKQANGTWDWQSSRRVVKEAANGSRRMAESRDKAGTPVHTTYAMLSYK